jgi:CheY-like chemotaxis protein
MPRVDGFELLLWLQARPRFKNVPKIVMSGSVLEEDLAKSLMLGATAYFTKPNGLEELVAMVREWKSAYLENAETLNG